MKSKTVAAGLLLCLVAACTAPAPPRSEGGTSGDPALCPAPQGGLGVESATTIDVVEQAYSCILANYYGGSTLDDRTLLGAGFAALTQELNRAGRDLPEAAMPALTGNRKADWAAFEAAFRRVAARLQDEPKLQEKLAVSALEAMVAALGDNHASWIHGTPRPPEYYSGDQYGLGLRANVDTAQLSSNPGTALPPLFVTTVQGGPAAAAGLRPGDLIESINGSPPFVGDTVVPAAVTALYPAYPDADPVTIQVKRQARRWTVKLKPRVFQPDLTALQQVTSKLLKNDVAYVRLRAFGSDVADRAFKAISRLRTGRTLTGLVLDLRGNTGGSADEVVRLLSGFVHGKVTAYQCAADGVCDTSRTDDTVALVNLPLAVLVDRHCASACDHFSAAVKDLGVAPLVGTRTAGAVAGRASPHLLGNNTILAFPTQHHLGVNLEVIDKIGVPPDHYVPATAADAAAGRDAALAKALTLLRE